MPDTANPMFTPQRRYFRLDRRDLAYLTFIVEACEGMATLSTVDKQETLVSLTTLPCRAAELDDFIEALRKEIVMAEMAGEDIHARHA